MTPEQLESVRRTAALVEQALDQCASCFYDDLFDRHPPARRLFADDLIAQQGTLVDELLSLVAAADDLHGFLAQARVLGLRHQRQRDPRRGLRLRGRGPDRGDRGGGR